MLMWAPRIGFSADCMAPAYQDLRLREGAGGRPDFRQSQSSRTSRNHSTPIPRTWPALLFGWSAGRVWLSGTRTRSWRNRPVWASGLLVNQILLPAEKTSAGRLFDITTG